MPNDVDSQRMNKWRQIALCKMKITANAWVPKKSFFSCWCMHSDDNAERRHPTNSSTCTIRRSWVINKNCALVRQSRILTTAVADCDHLWVILLYWMDAASSSLSLSGPKNIRLGKRFAAEITRLPHIHTHTPIAKRSRQTHKMFNSSLSQAHDICTDDIRGSKWNRMRKKNYNR